MPYDVFLGLQHFLPIYQGAKQVSLHYSHLSSQQPCQPNLPECEDKSEREELHMLP